MPNGQDFARGHPLLDFECAGPLFLRWSWPPRAHLPSYGRYANSPAVVSIFPQAGPVAGGTRVTVGGVGFLPAAFVERGTTRSRASARSFVRSMA